MYTVNLEAFLTRETRTIDLHPRAFVDVSQRFESLRGYRLLPSGRGRTTAPLTPSHLAAGLLSLSTAWPGYAGMAAHTLIP
jgi:hypothetical protein